MTSYSTRLLLAFSLLLYPLLALAQETPGQPESSGNEAAKPAAQEAAETETPAVQKPAAETPAAETPAAETPAAETPAAETPAAETPAAETPAAETPAGKRIAEGTSGVQGAGKQPTLPLAWVNSLQWRSIGPANMSGRISALAVNEKDPNMWWVASASGGLVKTVNNGITFEHLFDREATVSIGDVQVAPSDANIVWVGTGEANPRNSVSWGDGVYKSTDGGKTWKNMGLKQSFQIGRIAIHPTDPNVVYVGALGRLWGPNEDRGLYKTTDGGETWTKILYVDDKTGVIDVQMNLKNPETLLVATYQRQRDGFDGNDPAQKFGPGSGVYLTKDGGQTFQKATAGLPDCNLGRIGISIYRKDPRHIYLVLESEKIGQVPENAGYAGIRGEDADAGARVSEVVAKSPAEAAGLKNGDIVVGVNGKTVLSYGELVQAIDARQVGDKLKLSVSRDRKAIQVELELGKMPQPKTPSQQRGSSEPTTPEERARAGSKFAQSLGGQQENQLQGPDSHRFGGIYHSKDGGETWVRVNSLNPRPMYYSQIRVDPTNRQHIWVLGTQLYVSKDGGRTFSSENTARRIHVDHHAMWINPRDGRHILLGNDGGIHTTYDQGLNWDHLNFVALGQFYHVAVGPRRDYSVYGGLQDNGSWGAPQRGGDGRGAVNSDWISIGGGDGFVCAVDPEDPDQIYSESQGGATGRINLRTGERGSLRPRAERGVRYRFNWKTPFILSPHNSKIFYSAGNHVFRSPYKGNDLQAISPDITLTKEGTASALAESPVEEGVLYVGTTDGAIWVTKDGGHAWTNLFGMPTDGKAVEPNENQQGTVGKPETEPLAGSGPSEPAAEEPSGRQRTRSARGPGRLLDMLGQRDANGDGKLQRSEMPETMGRLFERLDANADGAIDEGEIRAMSQRSGQPARPDDPPPADQPGPELTQTDSAVPDSAVPEQSAPQMQDSPPQEAPPTQPAGPSGAEEPQQSEPAGNEPAQEPSAEPEAGQLEAPKEDAPKEEAPKEEAPKEEAPKEEAAKEEAPKEEAPKEEAPKEEAPKEEAPKEEAPKEEAPQQEDPKPETAKPADQPQGPGVREEVISGMIGGTWEGRFESENIPADRATFMIVLRMDPQGKVTGSFRSTMSEGNGEGTFNRETNELAFAVETEQATIDVTGTVSGTTMSGTVDVSSGAFSVPFSATRTGDAPAATADEKPADAAPSGKPLKELLPGPRWFSSIEASRFQRGRVYVTCDGHRSNDDAPYVFVSEDYGQTWRSLLANLPPSIGSTHVLREDVNNQNVLYLGTEFSIWVSVDRGESWTKLNSNLPTVAIHEVAVHPLAGEIVAATHGRSLWILDVAALRQVTADTIAADAHLYAPQPAILWRSRPSRGSSGTRQFTGELPPSGAAIYYSLGRDAGSVSIKITDIEGKTVRELEGKPEAGLHRVQWDLRRAQRPSPPRQGSVRGGGPGQEGRQRSPQGRGGGTVDAGKYLVTLSVDDTQWKQVLVVEDDPQAP